MRPKLYRCIGLVLSLLAITLVLSTLRFLVVDAHTGPNSGPTAGNDFITVHRSKSEDRVLLNNDSDPDGDTISITNTGWHTTAHGQLFLVSSGGYVYNPVFGYVGTDSFVYTLCDQHGACTTGTITFDVVNSPPVTAGETITVHRSRSQDNALLLNDSDPDNDPISISPTGWTTGAHGQFFVTSSGGYVYNPTFGYIGSDSYTYTVCDNWAGCTDATVTFDVVNSPPITVDKAYFTHGGFSKDGALLIGDSDPDGDPFSISPSGWQTGPHGSLFTTSSGGFVYSPNSGFLGADTYTINVCDNWAGCTPQNVTFYVVGNDDGVNDGESCPLVGRPINVTNGNMWLQQQDHELPAVGFPIEVTRTYNSKSTRVGLFGRGWSTAYDESIVALGNDLVRLNEADGRATYFGRPAGSSGPLTPLQGDFHGQLAQGGSGYTLTMTDGSSRQFNSAGKLVSITDRNNNSTTLTYGGSGLSSVTDPYGRVLTVNTNANGQVLSISDTLGTIATYNYGGSNQLLSVTYADNSAFAFGYDGGLRLTTVTDALGNVVEAHTYDGLGRALTSETHGGAERFTLSYVSATQTHVTDGLGRLTKYTFDTSKSRNVVTSVEGLCNCGGSQVQTWSYDNQLNVTSKTDALNHLTTFTYDSNGNRLTETDASGTVTFTYNQFGQVATRTNQLNGVNTNNYDGAGNLLTSSDALNNTSTFTYNGRGQVLTATDPRGKVTTFTYDAVGNLTQSRDANNITTFYFYDARSRLTKVRDALSRSTLYAYDAAGRINKITHPDLAFITFTYDLAGRRTVVTDERGNPTTYAYDGAYRLVSVTNALNHMTSHGYDAMSNMTSTTDALNRVTNYEYDDFNRLKKVIYPPATAGATRLFETIGYDAAGNVTQRTDTAGRVTSYAYDNVGRMSSTTNADNKTTTFEYDALSRPTALVDALSQRYEFAYDALGRQTGATRGGVSMSYQYDAADNRTQRTDYNGVVTNYAYDNLNRLTTITYPSRTVTFTYDALGNVSRATNENGSVYVYYDNRYRVKTVSDPFFYGITYNYDSTGNRTKLSLNGATYATYTFDAVNRLTNLADSASQNFPHAYDAVNRLTSRSAPNGVTTSYGYDDLDRLTTLNHAAGANTLIGNQYTHNDAGNIASWANASGNHAYTYDAVDRLTSATHSSQPNENYTYDAVGNRTSSHLSASYSYQPFNKLTNTASESYTFDNNGNLLTRTDSQGTTTFTWNEENQLTQVTLPGSLTINYKYDGLGRRIQRTTSAGADERYVYDGHDVLLDLNADWSVAASYLNGPGVDNHLRQTNAVTGVSYFLNDHLRSTAGLTDATGNLVEQLSYDSFGNSAGSAHTRYGYTGRERDPDTGQLYYRARFYGSQLGRFLSEDPIGFEGGINHYAYLENNAINDTDPFGLKKPRGGGPYHPPAGVKTSCSPGDSCPAIQGKMAVLMRMITSHEGWDRHVPRPRGGNRHAGEIADFWRAYANCQSIYERKCRNNNPTAPCRAPVRIPIGQSQGELDAKAESARQMHEFWKKVTIGGYLVSGVLTGGALFGGGAVAPLLVPVLVP